MTRLLRQRINARTLRQLAISMTSVATSVLASEIGWPRVDFDLDPITLLFAIFCGLLGAFLIGGMIALGLFSEKRKRTSMYENQWIDASDEASSNGVDIGAHVDDDPEPFVPEDATPRVSRSVAELFEVDDATIVEDAEEA